MRHTFLALLAAFLLSLSAFAQSSERAPATQPQTAAQTAPTASAPAARPEDVKSIDTILTALQERRRLLPHSPDGAGSYFLQHPFFESPIVNRVETFGNITQVFSSYESRRAAEESPFARGI